MTDPRPTTPTPELEQESPQEKLERERHPERDEPELEARTKLLELLAEGGALRNDEVLRGLGFGGDPGEWKAILWRLHNEGYVKVRWVGLDDPDPVELRLTDRGREWLASRDGGRSDLPLEQASGAPSAAAPPGSGA